MFNLLLDDWEMILGESCGLVLTAWKSLNWLIVDQMADNDKGLHDV